MSEERPEDPVGVLRRWERAGGTWELLTAGAAADGPVTIGLCTCVGGELVSRLTSADPALLRFVADHGRQAR